MSIVVGYLNTAEGHAAVHRAVELARSTGASLHLVGVVKSPKSDCDAPGYPARLEQAREHLEDIAAGLSVTPCHAHVPAGVQRPAEAILSVARQVDADTIVIGMRRRSRVGKLVLGSTAQEILIDSECEVLSVKAEYAAEARPNGENA